jgi:hypothetical protein
MMVIYAIGIFKCDFARICFTSPFINSGLSECFLLAGVLSACLFYYQSVLFQV